MTSRNDKPSVDPVLGMPGRLPYQLFLCGLCSRLGSGASCAHGGGSLRWIGHRQVAHRILTRDHVVAVLNRQFGMPAQPFAGSQKSLTFPYTRLNSVLLTQKERAFAGSPSTRTMAKSLASTQICPRYRNSLLLLGFTRSTYTEPAGVLWYPVSVNS